MWHLRICTLVVVVGCGGAPKPEAAPPPAPAATIAAPAAPTLAPLDEASVKAKSHELFDALDRFDQSAFEASVAPTFVMFQQARYLDVAFLRKSAQAGLDRHAPVRSRTWSDERVYVAASSAVFIGHAVQHMPAEGERPAMDRDGYWTLVWAADGGRWKAVYAGWARGGIEEEKEDWNDAFKGAATFNREPNKLLVEAVKGAKPGAALDLLTGQGRNAIYLATLGWKVTGVDISDEGLKIAREEAAKRKLKLDAVQADIDHWDLGKDKWDLVTMIYAGDDEKLVERVKPSLKKGGLFVLEYFSAEGDTVKLGAGGWATGALAKLFADGYTIVRDEVVEDVADWSLQKRKLVRFVARKK